MADDICGLQDKMTLFKNARLKHTVVMPLIKKSGRSMEMKSFWPVNNLPVVSKVAKNAC